MRRKKKQDIIEAKEREREEGRVIRKVKQGTNKEEIGKKEKFKTKEKEQRKCTEARR